MSEAKGFWIGKCNQCERLYSRPQRCACCPGNTEPTYVIGQAEDVAPLVAEYMRHPENEP